jgi:hypothetical protein
VRGTAAVKLKVVLERTDTIIKQAQLIVEASTVEEARQIVLGDLDAGVYDADCICVPERATHIPVGLRNNLPPSARAAN